MTMAGNYNNSIAITEPGICLFRNVCRSKQRRELALEWGADADKIAFLGASAAYISCTPVSPFVQGVLK